MLLRQAARAAARMAAARGPSLALPLQLLQRRRQEQQQLHLLPPSPPPLPSRALAAASRAVAARASSSSAAATPARLSPSDHHAVIQLIHTFDDYLNSGRHDEIGVFFVGGGGGSGGNGGSGSGNGSSGNGGSSNSGRNDEQAVVRVLQPGAASPVTHAGVPAIVAFFRACAPMARGNRHLVLNSLVEALPPSPSSSRPRAGVRSARLLVSATNPPALRASGVVMDVLVRTSGGGGGDGDGDGDGEWRILSRDLLMDPPAPAAPAA